MNREKHRQTAMIASMQNEQHHLAELRVHIDSLKGTNGALQRDVKSLQDLISEQKVGAAVAPHLTSSVIGRSHGELGRAL